MSTILKALRRLEEEKQSGTDRPLREEVATGGPVPAEEAPKRRGTTYAVLIGLWLLTMGVLAYTQWHQIEAQIAAARDAQEVQQAPQAPQPDRIAQAPSAASARRAPSPMPAPGDAVFGAESGEPAGTADAMPAEAYASEVEVLERPAPGPRAPLEYARAADPAPQSAPPPALDREPFVAEPAPAPPPVAASPKPEPAPPPVAASPEPAPKAPPMEVPPEPAPKPEPAPTEVARAEPPAPSPAPAAPPKPAPEAEPSAAVGADAEGSDLSVERTQWHPSASRRAAFVALGDADARRVEEGDQVGDYVVSEIQVTGVVFLRDGSLITRKVGTR